MAPRRIVKIFPNQVFGRLHVIKAVKRECDPSHQYFLCKCVCGKEKIANGTSLLRGDVLSCGCLQKERKESYLNKRREKTSLPIGYQSGQLTVVEDLGIIQIKSKKEHCYRCKCSCGKEIVVRQYLLKKGQQSCGCITYERSQSVRLNKLREERFFPDYLSSFLVYQEEIEGLKNKVYTYESKLHFRCSKCGCVVERKITDVLRLNKDKESPVVLCLDCSNHRSSFEQEVYDYIRTLIPDTYIQTNIWSILKDDHGCYEIDIYIPDKKIGIECNGDYFHSEQNGKKERFHQKKFELAEKSGVHLIQIFQSFWKNNNQRIKLYLKDLFITTHKVYARSCMITVIEKQVAKEFYNKNHIQGYTSLCRYNFALVYKEEIIAVMSFNLASLHALGKQEEGFYELVRYAVKSGYSVIGGSSKLLTYFERKYNPSKLLSYSENNYFTGNMYSKLGFTFDGMSKPRYHWYMKDQTTRTREQCQLKSLSKKYPSLYLESLSIEGNKETYIMTSLGSVKVWHAGNKRWIKRYNYKEDNNE